MKKIVIDCDPGHDDAIAIVLAHRHADVLGITTVSGNAPLPATTANALLVTALLGVDTPVHVGAAKPLAGEPIHAAVVHGEDGLGGVERIAHERTVASNDAVAFLLDAPDKDTWIVPVGPLTNIALAIERDPAWVNRIAGISLMGGSAGPGNATPAAEFNILADPEAAERVFASGAEIIMCGLDLTQQLRTDDETCRRLRETGTPLAKFAAQAFDHLHERMQTLVGRRDAALHDPCAVLAVTHPQLIHAEPRHVAVETKGRLTRGMTVVDERIGRRRNDPTAKVAYRLDAPAAMALVMASLTT